MAPAADTVTEKITESVGDAYLMGGLDWLRPDDTRGVDSGLGANYGYGRALSDRNGWELRLFTNTLETGVPGATDFYQYGGGLDFIHQFGPRWGGRPFMLVGGGAVSNDVSPDANDEVGGYANAGLGWRSKPWSRWGLRTRVEARGIYDTFADGVTDLLAGVTLEIPTQRVRTIERERIVEKIVEKEVVRTVTVTEPPADRDGDGIPDATDTCPDTVAGAKVEPDGCVHKEQVVVLPNIEFEFARAELTAAGKETLQTVLRFLNDQKEIRLEVWGHTDAIGGDVYNLKLSQKRAASVVAFLTANGIAAARLDSAGFGETRPLASNDTDEGRERNRRVELHIRASTRAEGSS